MKIGIDARLWGPSNGGLGRYVAELVAALQILDRKHEYVIFLRRNNFSACPLDLAAPNFTKVVADIPWYGWKEQLALTPLIKRARVDLMHFPHWNVPFSYHDPFVVTVHDLIMYHYPRAEASTLGPVGYWCKDKAARLVIRHAVRGARRILTTSEFTRRDIHETLGVPSGKMTVAYQAPATFRSPDAGASFSAPAARSAEMPYVLYVGSAYPHKNLSGLLRAWQIFSKKRGASWRLVLAGREDFFYRQLKESAAAKALPNLEMLGFVSDRELPALYANASAYVFPSLYEGFGLPPLEAMRYGVPVAAADRACLPEVLGDAAV